MPTELDYEALRERYVRLRRVARLVVDAAEYPSGDDEPRIYASQLRDLKRELDGEPQPSAMAWMSVS